VGEDSEVAGVAHLAVRWTPSSLSAVAEAVETGGDALARLDARRLVNAWRDAVAAFRDRRSIERRALDDALARTTRLSAEGLAAGLEAVLGGLAGEEPAAILAETEPAHDRRPVVIFLASNLPALGVQPLLPALALRRPAILKSPSAEPLFLPAFVAALTAREPALGNAVAAVTWRGGDRDLEAPLLTAAHRVVAYGESDTLADLDRRAPGKLVGYGPKTSLAVVGPASELGPTAAGLARDVALFDQRGCLSIAAVYTTGPTAPLAAALAAELAVLAHRWPPGPPDPLATAAVRQLRDLADLEGLHRPDLGPDLPLAAGTVVVDPDPTFRTTPGLRTVRIHPLPDPTALPAHLHSWRGRLQGCALAGLPTHYDAHLRHALATLGVSRYAPPGELQSPGARWHNGGIDPLAALA